MLRNPDLLVEVSAHTDNTGDDRSNRQLSLERANAVYRYLLSKGIAAEALLVRGYGEDRPVADNSSESGRAKNRRVEFRVMNFRRCL